MRRCAIDQTLHGYVFCDRTHARKWLGQYAEQADRFSLEEVEVGPLMPCPRCGGHGYRQDVKVVSKVTYAEVMTGKETTDAA